MEDLANVAHLTDGELSRLCAELDLGFDGRQQQTDALMASVTTTADVNYWHVVPRCTRGRCAFVDTLGGTKVTETIYNESIPAVGPASIFVSHVWATDFDELLSALGQYMLTVPLEKKKSEYFWVDIMCINRYEAVVMDSGRLSGTFSRMISAINHTLFVCIPALAPAAVGRSWCIWEVFCTMQTGAALTIGTSAAEADALTDIGGYDAAIGKLAGLDSLAAVSTYAVDKARIDEAILAAGGHAAINHAVSGRLLAELLSRVLVRGCEHFELVRKICEAGASLETEVGPYRSTALITASAPRPGVLERSRLRRSGQLDAIRERDAAVVRYLLEERRACANAQSSTCGETALISACRYGDRPIVRHLLAAGADPNLARHDDGETAFLTAARWGNPHVLRDLASAGADVRVACYSHFLERVSSAAMWQKMYSSAENLELLRECGCDLGYCNDDGTSAASLAADGGHVEALRFLLDEVCISDRDGRLRARLKELEANPHLRAADKPTVCQCKTSICPHTWG